MYKDRLAKIKSSSKYKSLSTKSRGAVQQNEYNNLRIKIKALEKLVAIEKSKKSKKSIVEPIPVVEPKSKLEPVVEPTHEPDSTFDDWKAFDFDDSIDF